MRQGLHCQPACGRGGWAVEGGGLGGRFGAGQLHSNRRWVVGQVWGWATAQQQEVDCEARSVLQTSCGRGIWLPSTSGYPPPPKAACSPCT